MRLSLPAVDPKGTHPIEVDAWVGYESVGKFRRQPHGGPMTAASDRRPIHERCWCWQHGRCLTDCPTADLPPPVPMTDAHWHRAWNELRGVADR